MAILSFGPANTHAQQMTYSVDVQSGFNSIANHLMHDGNRLNDIIPNAPDGSLLFKFNPATQAYFYPAIFYPGIGWIAQEPEMEYLHPGEGAFLWVNESKLLTFSGVIQQFPLPRQVAFDRYYFVSAHEPRTMNFMELFGFPPTDGDVVYLYDRPFTPNPDDFKEGASSVHKFIGPHGWDSIAPMFRRGRSGFVFLSRAPRIMAHPKSQTVSATQKVTLDVTMLSRGPFNYQWQFNGDDLPGAIDPTLVLSNIHFLQAGAYSVVVSNPFGEMTSKPAYIRVSSPPVILDPPRPVRTIPGMGVEFRVRAVGTPVLRYEWFRNNQLIPNETNPVLQVSAVMAPASSNYHVRITNPLGSIQSQPVVLEVNEPPEILEQPASITVSPGQTAFFQVVARGTPPLRYQWRRNGRKLQDETNSTLVIRETRPTNSGLYQVTVANVAGAVESDVVELTVEADFIFLADRIEESKVYEMPFFTGRGDNIVATNETNEVHCLRPGGSSVWLRWMAKERGIVRFETSGSSFDTLLAAYTMNAAGGGLTEVVCDDDEGEFLGSRIHFAAMPDTEYFIAIDGVDGARGKILLDWELTPTDEILPEIVEHPKNQTAPFGGQVVFTVRANNDPTFYIWYRNGVEIEGQHESRLFVGPVTNQQLGYYYVDVYRDQRFARSRRAYLQVSMADSDTRLLEAFAADKFADAFDRASTGGVRSLSGTAFTPVLGYTGTQIFSTVGFEGEPGELSHCGIPGGSSAWFTFIPAANGRLYLHTTGSSFNTVLAVYTGPGPTIASLTPLICDDDSGPGTTSSLNFAAIKNTVYYIALDGYNGVTGTAQLNYRLLVPITLTNMIKTNATISDLRITATPSYPFTIQRCSGFQIWTSVLITNSPTGNFHYYDTNATPIRRFYRAIQTP